MCCFTRRVQEIRRRVPYVTRFQSALPWMTLRPLVPYLTPDTRTLRKRPFLDALDLAPPALFMGRGYHLGSSGVKNAGWCLSVVGHLPSPEHMPTDARDPSTHLVHSRHVLKTPEKTDAPAALGA